MAASGTCTDAKEAEALHEQTRISGRLRESRPRFEIDVVLPRFVGRVGVCSSSGNARHVTASSLPNVSPRLSRGNRDAGDTWGHISNRQSTIGNVSGTGAPRAGQIAHSAGSSFARAGLAGWLGVGFPPLKRWAAFCSPRRDEEVDGRMMIRPYGLPQLALAGGELRAGTGTCPYMSGRWRCFCIMWPSRPRLGMIKRPQLGLRRQATHRRGRRCHMGGWDVGWTLSSHR